MPGARLSVRKIREILRLKFDLKRSNREVGRACRVSAGTVWDVMHRLKASGLQWPVPDHLSDEALEERLYRDHTSSATSRPTPDWADIHHELRKPHVTLALLWQEYRRIHPEDGYEYSRFCELYADWRDTRCNPIMRQHHRLGEKAFVDFAGSTIPIVCRLTGLISPAQLFVAVLGGSNLTFIEPVPAQDLLSWLRAHVAMFDYFGGCPEVVVPDNLKAGVTKACFYDPVINPSYQALADHYGVAILPARSRKPRDKAKAEQGVLMAERWVVAVLRKQTFYSIQDLRRAIWELNERINDKPFRKIPGCRRSLFEGSERPLLRPLPSEPFQVMLRREMTVHLDYHVELEGQFFSVPYRLIKKKVMVHYTAGLVEIFHDNRKVASHERKAGVLYHTERDHMPSHHRFLAEWSPERFQTWSAKMGPATAELVGLLLQSREHPEQSFRACLGILQGLPRKYGPVRVEAACARALAVGGHSYRSVASILDRSLDQQPLPGAPVEFPSAGIHENVRGAAYYN